MSKTYKPLDEILKQSGVRYEAIAKNMGITYNALYRIRLAPNKLTLDKVKELERAANLEESSIYDLMKNFNY
ncbi:hypothetical protein RI092_11600 [Lactococcus cremoris]|uniref:hypothetical protein n=1 Tax=Lactococcus lactis subsp. cremoris TaxID=1359 RepID=UPI002870B77B|nr:hypothetical protein [Lactococcus cremoris]MDR9868429.1 hypothetical protein [Lactococcus cremoris]